LQCNASPERRCSFKHVGGCCSCVFLLANNALSYCAYQICSPWVDVCVGLKWPRTIKCAGRLTPQRVRKQVHELHEGSSVCGGACLGHQHADAARAMSCVREKVQILTGVCCNVDQPQPLRPSGEATDLLVIVCSTLRMADVCACCQVAKCIIWLSQRLLEAFFLVTGCTLRVLVEVYCCPLNAKCVFHAVRFHTTLRL
jgi:hypothetical protein